MKQQPTIGRQIAAARKKKKLTQTELADLVGVAGKRVIYSYESGERLPSIEMLNKIAAALGCAVSVSLVTKGRVGPDS